jgi:hypothetical protein
VSFFLSFWADKYGLLRIWKQSPKQNGQVAQMMGIFVAISVLAHMMASKFFYSAWPFDNRCKSEHGDFYEKCDSLTEAFYFEYKFTTPQPQRLLTKYYEWMVILTILFGFGYAALFKSKGFFHSLFHAKLRDTSDAAEDRFSQTQSIKLYVPEVHLPFQVNPLLACDMEKVDSRHLGWIGDYEANNLYSFAKKVVDDDFDGKTMFSRCKQYVKHNDRLLRFALKIQRARRAKVAYRRSLQELADLAAEQEKEKQSQLLAEQTKMDMERLQHQQREILRNMQLLQENQRELMNNVAHAAASTGGAAATAVDEKQVHASQTEAIANSAPQAEGAPPAAPLPGTATLQRKSRKEVKKKKTKTPRETFFCRLSEGPFKGEQQELSFSPTGLRIKSTKGEMHVLWKAVEKWRVLEGSGFEFDTVDTKYPFVCDSAEHSLAIFQVFQEKGMLLIRGYRFQENDGDEGDEADDKCVVRVKADGVSVNNGPWLNWSNVTQWNLEPGDEEEMDIFEFWAGDSTGEETEYAVECDGIDAVYLNAGFDHRINESTEGKAPPTFQRQRVIV